MWAFSFVHFFHVPSCIVIIVVSVFWYSVKVSLCVCLCLIYYPLTHPTTALSLFVSLSLSLCLSVSLSLCHPHSSWTSTSAPKISDTRRFSFPEPRTGNIDKYETTHDCHGSDATVALSETHSSAAHNIEHTVRVYRSASFDAAMSVTALAAASVAYHNSTSEAARETESSSEAANVAVSDTAPYPKTGAIQSHPADVAPRQTINDIVSQRGVAVSALGSAAASNQFGKGNTKKSATGSGGQSCCTIL
jgi:hypothetical protein